MAGPNDQPGQLIPVDQNANLTSWGMPPNMGSGLTFRELGNSGLRQYSGWVREEFLPDLVGRQGARAYREMLDNSPIIGGLMFAINGTMRKVEWRVTTPDDQPASKESEDF